MKNRIYLLLILFFNIIVYSQSDLKVILKNLNNINLNYTFTSISDSIMRVNISYNENQPQLELKKNNFEIIEDGIKDKIISVKPISKSTRSNVHVNLILDNSSSMSPYSKYLVKILDSLVNSFSISTAFTVYTFSHSNVRNENINSFVEKKYFNNNNEHLKFWYNKKYEDQMLNPKTYLYDQIFSAFQSNSGYKKDDNFFIIFSDGEDVGSKINRKKSLSSFKDNGKVYIIDFNLGRKNSFLVSLANITNGEYYKAENVTELAKYFKTVGERIIHSGYEILYEPFRPPKFLSNQILTLKNNQFFKVNNVNIKKVIAKEYFPLLNYIFYDQNSFDINNKFLDQFKGSDFNENSLNPEQILIYYNLLNIIGNRIKKNPGNITLVGCNSNEGIEKNNKFLSESRAITLKNYFIKNFNLDDKYFTIKFRNLPDKSSNINIDEGKQENRRVEIIPSDISLLDLVEVVHNSVLVNPATIFIKPLINSYYKIKEWVFELKIGNQIVFTKKGTDDLPESINLNLEQILTNLNLDKDDYMIFEIKALNIKDNWSQPFIQKYPVTFESINKESIDSSGIKIEKLSLVLFDFNSSELSERNKRALDKIKTNLLNAKKIIIRGYTDNIGAEEYNYKLSLKRAENIKTIIKNINNNVPIEVEGLGELSPLYDNSTPEGRFYNRTCQIIIEL